MAIRERATKKGTSYDVATFYRGKQYWEFGSKTRREAERLDARNKAAIANGTYLPPSMRQRAAGLDPTNEEYSQQWGEARTNASASDDRRNLARFMTAPGFGGMRLAETRPRHVIAALEWLKAHGGVKLKTLQNAYGTLATLYRDAVIAELIAATPCVLPRGYFEGEDAEEREPYQRTEAALLVSHHKIPWPIRVLNAMCLLAGFREGEACGRRWRDLDMGPEPLWALDVKTQYEGRKLKTRRARVAPVHPELRALLEAWGSVGFPQFMGRAPTPDDFIVPHRSAYSKAGHWTKSTYSKAFVRSAAEAGIPNRTLHAMRHTMITLARRGGADKAVLTRVTHNPAGDIVDRYTHRDWTELCAAVLAIGSLFSSPQTPPKLGNPPSFSAFPVLPESTLKPAGAHVDTTSSRLQFPAPPPRKQQKTSHFANPVQTPDQSGSAGPDTPRRSDEGAWEEVIGEHPGAAPPPRPPAKTRPVGYVARKRGARG